MWTRFQLLHSEKAGRQLCRCPPVAISSAAWSRPLSRAVSSAACLPAGDRAAVAELPRLAGRCAPPPRGPRGPPATAPPCSPAASSGSRHSSLLARFELHRPQAPPAQAPPAKSPASAPPSPNSSHPKLSHLPSSLPSPSDLSSDRRTAGNRGFPGRRPSMALEIRPSLISPLRPPFSSSTASNRT